MNSTMFRLGLLCLLALLLVGAAAVSRPAVERSQAGAEQSDRAEAAGERVAMTVQYLEIVTPMVDGTCEALAAAHGVEFGEPVPEFGNARTADLAGGGRIGVRAPMRETEEPVVRPYILVDDIEAAVKAAEEAGATVAIPPMEIPGQGMFSIYILGGIDHGLWQK